MLNPFIQGLQKGLYVQASCFIKSHHSKLGYLLLEASEDIIKVRIGKLSPQVEGIPFSVEDLGLLVAVQV